MSNNLTFFLLCFYSFQHQLLPLPPKARHVSSSDFLILEDELQRILLIGNIQAGEFVTGVVLALLGYEDDTGKFFVEEICPADMPINSSDNFHFSSLKK